MILHSRVNVTHARPKFVLPLFPQYCYRGFFHAFMLGPTTAFYVMEEKRVSDCISVIRDVSRVFHELRRSEFKNVRLIRAEQ